MPKRTIEVTLTETVTVRKTVKLEIDGEGSPLKSEIEQRAREEAYKKLVSHGDHSWELTDSEGPDYEFGDLEVDYSAMTNDEEAMILQEIVAEKLKFGDSAELLEVGDVASMLREDWNNDVIDKMEADGTDFQTAFETMVAQSTAATIIASGNVYSELREHYNNEILDRWAGEMEIIDE